MANNDACMNRRVLHYLVYLFPVLAVIASCAKVSSPSGGPKDIEVPFVEKSEPLNGQTNFRGRKIMVTFNEFVSLDKINEKFMVSPPLEKKPVISLRGRSVIVEFSEDLKDSTTYTFYFQDAIRDLNESNPIDNFQFVVSTGNVIDSLSVTGNVVSAHSLDPPENTIVLLHSDITDSAFIKKIPDYITRVTKTGYFRIDNVKKGTYRLYALKDDDNSKNFNFPEEEIAFCDSVIHVTAERNYIPIPVPVRDSVSVSPVLKKTADTTVIRGDHQLFLFKPMKKTRYLTSSDRKMKYKLVFTLSLPPDSTGFDFEIPGAAPGAWFLERSRDNDTITVWLTDSTLYSMPQLTTLASFPFTDSLGNIIRKQDTVRLRYMEPRTPRGRTGPQPLKVVSGLSAGSLRPGQNIIFSSETPLSQPDTSKIRIYELSEKDRINVPYRFEKDEKNSCRIFLRASFEQKKNYLFIADSAAFSNIYSEVSDSTGNRFSIRNDDSFGKLILNITNFEGNRIIQLLNNQDKVLREIIRDSDGEVEFNYIDKGTYRLRVIYDLNGDGKWTTGDFSTHRQPEPVTFYPREIPINENHWVSQDWDIGVMNVKKVKSASGTRPGRQ
jgi:hypothetical protein